MVTATMSAVYYLGLLDDSLLHHSSELSILTTGKCNKIDLKLEKLVATAGVQQNLFLNFLHWLLFDQERRTFVEKNCCIEIHGGGENLQVLFTTIFYINKSLSSGVHRFKDHNQC